MGRTLIKQGTPGIPQPQNVPSGASGLFYTGGIQGVSSAPTTTPQTQPTTAQPYVPPPPVLGAPAPPIVTAGAPTAPLPGPPTGTPTDQLAGIGGGPAGGGGIPAAPAGPMTGIDFSGLGPSFSRSQNLSQSMARSGLQDPWAREYIRQLVTPGEGSIYSSIDDWMNDIIGQYRVTGDQAANVMNQVANQRAAQGIMAGTEAENLRANVLSNLAQQQQARVGDVLGQGMNLKSGMLPTLMNLLSTTESQSTGGGESYSQSPEDYRIIASMIQSNF